MASHVYHQDLPGYDPRQLLVDGCPECEHRGRDIVLAINHLDTDHFQQAWDRGLSYVTTGNAQAISQAESRLLEVVGSVRVRLMATFDDWSKR